MEEMNFGILTSIDWNSRNWHDVLTKEDLEHTTYGYVKKNGYSNTAINFGHELFPVDAKGYYHGLLPQLWSRMPDRKKVKSVVIVFMRSYNYRDSQQYIVGFYAYPKFQKSIIPSPLKSFTKNFEMNVKAYPKDILLLENFVRIDRENILAFLPDGKELGKQGFNYLTASNVYNILVEMTTLNPNDSRLSSLKFRLIKSMERK